MKRFGIAVILLWTLAITVARSLRWPNDFAEAHWLIDYRFGFIKRGLAGSLLSFGARLTDTAITLDLIQWTSLIVLIAFCGALVWMAMRVITVSGFAPESVLLSLLFLSSPFAMLSGHLIGYLDHLVIPFSILALFLALNGWRWAGAFVLAVAILIHEVTLLIGLPCFCLALLPVSGDGWLRTSLRGLRPKWFLPVCVPVGVFVVLAVGQMAAPTAELRVSLVEHLSGYAFIGEDRATLVPEWQTLTFTQQISSLRHVFLRVTHPAYYLMVLPTTLAVLYALRDRLIANIDRVLLLSVVFLPQVMHLVAWDSTRIWTLSVFCAFAALWVSVEQSGKPRMSRRGLVGCLVGIGIHVFYETPLMDGESDHTGWDLRLLLFAPTLGAAAWVVWKEERQAVRA